VALVVLFLCGFLYAIVLSGLFIFFNLIGMKCYISLIVLNMQFTFIVVVKYVLKRLTLEQQILNRENTKNPDEENIFKVIRQCLFRFI
jgi:hypothetical protein